jgi:Kef-type K+ transport system membrane component KefB
MDNNIVIFSIFLIFSGAAMMATLALYTRQSLLMVYIGLGMLLGPWGLRLMSDPVLIKQTGEVGIVFLLFLMGLNLSLEDFVKTFRNMAWVALLSSLIFAAIGFVIAYYSGLNRTESIVVGGAMMFSSTIIGLKLLPTTVLHHQHVGEVMIGVLLLQDIIAIITLLILKSVGVGGSLSGIVILKALIAFPVLTLVGYVAEKYLLRVLLARFDYVREYIFLLMLGWCLAFAQLAQMFNLSYEVGAFIAGIVVAASPVALYVAESLKPLRDFFLVMFFFSVGAGFNWHYGIQLFWPALILAVAMMVLKPTVFALLLRKNGEPKAIAWEIGVRLAQNSEFSLLLAYLARSSGFISKDASNLIQSATILTFLVASYWVVLKYPSPLAFSTRLRRD